jgi:hypothetical protein
MKNFLTLLFILSLFSACYTENSNTPPVYKNSKINVPQLKLSNKNLSITYIGTINDIPASVHLVIKDAGQKIRTDIKTNDGTKTIETNYLKLNDDFYFLDKQNSVVSQRDFSTEDFIHFFYLPTEQLLSNVLRDNNMEVLENENLLSQSCSHFRIRTDTSSAEFLVWNNILLKINTEIRSHGEIQTLKLQAVSLEKELNPNTNLFIKPIK